MGFVSCSCLVTSVNPHVNRYYIGQDLVAVGMWSTGIYDKDNLMYVRIDGVNRYNIYLDLQGADVTFGVSACTWIKPCPDVNNRRKCV